MPHAKEPKKKAYTPPVLTDFGQGSSAREKIIDLAVSKGISKKELKRLLSKLGVRKIHDKNNRDP